MSSANGRVGVGDLGGDHRDFETGAFEYLHQRRKVLLHLLGQDVAALADGDVDAVEAEVGRRLGQFGALHEREMLGEDRDFELSFGGRGGREQRGGAGQHGAAG